MRLFDLIKTTARVELSLAEYSQIAQRYRMTIEGAMREYLFTDNARPDKYRNRMKVAVVEAFWPAFEQGLKDGGGTPPPEPDDQDWLNARVEGELANVTALFNTLKTLKKDPETGYGEYEYAIAQHTAGYLRTLDGIYSAGKVRGAANRMLTFGGDDGAESCTTCQKYKGKRHKATWWTARGLVPYQGNPNFECGCWQCQHYLYDDNGNVYSI